MTRAIVLGAGAIGAYYGGQLARAGHDVTLYARGENLAAIRRSGLEIRTPEGSTVVKVAATDRADELGAADFAILGVKSYSLDSIGPVVRQVAEKGAAILPFLNGVETTDHLLALGVLTRRAPRGSDAHQRGAGAAGRRRAARPWSERDHR